jgi:hypothetical protein
MFVRCIIITVTPVTNAERPAIEKTDRINRYPRYMLPLIKAKWGPKAKVTAAEIPDDKQPYWQLPLQPNMSPEDSELLRCRGYVGKDTFYQAYRDEDFRVKVRAEMVEADPSQVERDEREAALQDLGVKKAAKELVKAAGDAEANIQRKQDAKAKASGVKPTRKQPVGAA